MSFNVWNVCDMLSFSAISRVVLRRLFSIIAFILSSSTSVERQKRGESLRSKSPEREGANQFWHWRSINDFSHKHYTTFSELALRFYHFESNKVRCDENDRLQSPFQINAK